MLRMSLEADSGPSYPLRLSFTSNGPWGRAANYSEDGVPAAYRVTARVLNPSHPGPLKSRKRGAHRGAPLKKANQTARGLVTWHMCRWVYCL